MLVLSSSARVVHRDRGRVVQDLVIQTANAVGAEPRVVAGGRQPEHSERRRQRHSPAGALDIEAFPYDTGPRYLHRDRDSIYGSYFNARVRGMGVKQVVSASRSPWQNPYVERVIGSIRRECTDHLIITRERHLRKILHLYVEYYNADRIHDSLGKVAPDSRVAQSRESGTVVALPRIGGLHNHYERRAA